MQVNKQQPQGCRKLHRALRKKTAILPALFGALFAFETVLTPLASAQLALPVYAAEENAEEDTRTTQEKLDDAKEAAQQTKESINANQETIEDLGDTKEDLNAQISDLNTKLTGIVSEMNVLDDQIEDKQDEIDLQNDAIEQAQADLEEATRQQEQQYASMKKRVQFLYERGRNYYLELLLKFGSFGNILNRKHYIDRLSAYDDKQLEELKQARAQVEEKKAQLEAEQQKLLAEQDELEELHANQQAKRNDVNSLVASAAGSLSLTDAQLADATAVTEALQDQLEAQNQEITALQKQLAEERRLQQISDQGVWRDLSSIVFEEGDRYLLANLIYCEAGNQPFDGQVAVGAVVMNRIMSPAFPSTMSGVIYQSWQFEPAMTGRLALALSVDQATDACYQAADAAMAGQSTVGNCLFFRTPIPEIEPKYVIGGHIFY